MTSPLRSRPASRRTIRPGATSLAVLVAAFFVGSAPHAQQDVDIYYDAFSIPHIFGETDEAAMYGLGYHQMLEYPIGTLDRLWRWSGRMSEVAGPSYLDQDFGIRLWEVQELVDTAKAELDPDYLGLLDAFVAGIEAGRAWWRDGNSPPTASARLKSMMGTTADPDNVEMHVDPLPDYLNQGFHPFQFDPDAPGIDPDYLPGDVPQYIRLIVDRLFDPANVITPDHVLALGIVQRSPLYRAAEIRFIPNDGSFFSQARRLIRLPDPPVESESKGWGISTAAAGGEVVTVQDGHTSRDTIPNRPYLIQIHGDEYRTSGLIHPGLPYVVIGLTDQVSRVGTGSGGNDAVIASSWDVTLEGTLPLRFRYGALLQSGGGKAHARVEPGPPMSVRFHRLQKETDTLTYFDVLASKDTDKSGTIELDEHVFVGQVRERYYAPDPMRIGFPNHRMPVVRVNGTKVDGKALAPGVGDVVTFEQANWTHSGADGEFYWRLGRIKYIDNAPMGEDQVVDVLDDDLGVHGNNFSFFDYQNRFYSLDGAKAAIQGPNIAKRFLPDQYGSISSGEIRLNGHLPEDYWLGFHPRSALPQIGPVTVTGPEVWVNTVGTLDLVDARLSENDLASFSPDIIRPYSTPTWAYVRARELLMQGAVPPNSLDGASDAVCTDVAETPMIFLWDYFKKARDIRSAELGADPDVDRFIAFIETYRHLSDDGLTCDPANFDFTAHPYSVVTPYSQLLRSYYSDELDDLAPSTELEVTFGDDPVHPLFDVGTAGFVRPTYDANIDAMWNALVGAATPGIVPLWKAGTGPGGIVNEDVLVQQWMKEPWASDPRYSDTQTFLDLNAVNCSMDTFADDMGGDRVIRWGHINILVSTAHFAEPGPASQLNAVPDRFKGNLYMGLRPDLLAGLDPGNTINLLTRLKFPVYQNMTPIGFPIGGVGDSLFPTCSNRVEGLGQVFDNYDQTLYKWSTSPNTFFPLVPHERGAQVMVQARLFDPPAAQVTFLAATGGTELTIPVLPHQQRFAPSADFASRTWRPLETDRTVVEANAVHHVQLTYTP